jgi:hypothetical protein
MRWSFWIVMTALACGGSTTPSASNARSGTAPIATTDHGKGISLTGGGAYGDRHDPSGWTGVSTPPTAVGGGPKPQPSVSAEPPKAQPPPTPTIMPPSKELDTAPPAKDLQF